MIARNLDQTQFTEEYVAKLASGDADTLEEFVAFFADGLRARDVAYSEDVLRESYLRFWRSARSGYTLAPETLAELLYRAYRSALMDRIRMEHDDPSTNRASSWSEEYQALNRRRFLGEASACELARLRELAEMDDARWREEDEGILQASQAQSQSLSASLKDLNSELETLLADIKGNGPLRP